jgi:hypothetical protein
MANDGTPRSMMYMDMEYQLLRSSSPGVIFWSFTPPDSIPIRGRSKSLTSGRVAAENAIKKWLKENSEQAT